MFSKKKNSLKGILVIAVLSLIIFSLIIGSYILYSYFQPIAKWEWGREPCHSFTEIEYGFGEAEFTISNEECKIINGEKELFFLLKIENKGSEPLKFKKEEFKINDNPVSWDSQISIVPNYIYEIPETNSFKFYIPVKDEDNRLKVTNSGLI